MGPASENLHITGSARNARVSRLYLSDRTYQPAFWHFAFVPGTDSCTAANKWTGCNDLLDHLVGERDWFVGDRQAERLGCLAIDH
jgi:hypothetical protein